MLTYSIIHILNFKFIATHNHQTTLWWNILHTCSEQTRRLRCGCCCHFEIASLHPTKQLNYDARASQFMQILNDRIVNESSSLLFLSHRDLMMRAPHMSDSIYDVREMQCLNHMMCSMDEWIITNLCLARFFSICKLN